MSSGVCVWFLTLLVVSFVSRNDAIKCFQCEDCPDKTKLKEARECTKVTLDEDNKEHFSKVDEIKPAELKDDGNGMKAEVKAEVIEIRTCYKVVSTNRSVEFVSRGCSPYFTPKVKECASSKREEKCLYVCEEDECNNAPTSVVAASTISACLVVLLAQFIV